jgi:predicted O-methyltransferase YrrM
MAQLSTNHGKPPSSLQNHAIKVLCMVSALGILWSTTHTCFSSSFEVTDDVSMKLQLISQQLEELRSSRHDNVPKETSINDMLRVPARTRAAKATDAQEKKLYTELERQASRGLDKSVEMLPEHIKNNLLRAQATGNDVYFDHAEKFMDADWQNRLLPNLPTNADYRYVLELAPGHGRNTAKILNELHPQKLVGVDINPDNIEFLRNRFAEHAPNVQFYVTGGVSIPAAVESGVTFVYSYDAMVHFDKEVIGAYLKEVSRLMKPGAMGLIHHSQTPRCPETLPTGFCSNPDIIGHDEKNVHQRNANSKEEFVSMANAAGLEVLNQVDVVWDPAYGVTDAISTFRKPV